MQYLIACLDALQLSSEHFDEVVIADDGSSQPVVDELQQTIGNYDFPITHAWHSKDGFRLAASRNNGIRQAKGDYLIFIDCDFLVLPGMIQCHLEARKSGMFVAGLCKYLTESTTKEVFSKGISARLLYDLYADLPEKPIIRDHRRFIKYSILCKLRLASPKKQRCSSHFSIHKKDMEYINGYDENFIGWGGEDEDMALRLVQAGFSGKSIMPRAKVLHLWHRKELGNRKWQEGGNVAYLNRKQVSFFCQNGLRKVER